MVLLSDHAWESEISNFNHTGIFCTDVYNHDHRRNVGFLRDFNLTFYAEILERKSLICKGYDAYFKANLTRGLPLRCEIA